MSDSSSADVFGLIFDDLANKFHHTAYSYDIAKMIFEHTEPMDFNPSEMLADDSLVILELAIQCEDEDGETIYSYYGDDDFEELSE